MGQAKLALRNLQRHTVCYRIEGETMAGSSAPPEAMGKEQENEEE